MSGDGRLGLTTARQAVISVLAGAVVCGLILLGFEAAGSFPPVVPWSVPALMLLLAVGVAVYARLLPRRIEERRVEPQESVAALAVGKSMIMTGAVLAGAHVVYVARFLQLFEAPLPSARVVQGIATIIAALLLAVAGAMLERACVVHDDDDDDKPGGTGAASPA
ncbi:hypothetical protein BCR15_13305 [Tessaracoccus lapidicaptus]|uniref:Uncharacterized protein n=1 Tax=Tessaracoccus lapidicaptus TaxID=1427523 RepID=A0A1C0ARH2_9ACTN|nr:MULTISPECIES: DUF3180 domain-containing protein [Tessaracoccus]AQX16346.1 hypothetical protein BKM78_10840 [Tessaracoccus sp. T2.5-30]OCL36785.1 hypothetical protein BCR15_13305 [Tessaracoccus lapidicaptus]VEP40966.1 hypothetical protein TLA_TLA_02184 [Tessaracoccus lapidicaptus]